MGASFTPWDGFDLRELLALDERAPDRFSTRCVDPNEHGRAYGGQVLAQALTAAARTVEPGRLCTAMQFMFLQGALIDEPMDLQVTPLQEGKRFSARHVHGSQAAGARLIFDAQVSFATTFAGPSHQIEPSVPLGDPDRLPPVSELPRNWRQAVYDAFGYPLEPRPVLDFRFPDPPTQLRLSAAAPCLRFWVRVKEVLPDDPHLQAAAFAYLSDWWLNYAAIGAHQDEATANGRLYVASLNHAMWLHDRIRADEWLHFESVSPAAGRGRGLNVARIHDRHGRLVASVTQECLMAE